VTTPPINLGDAVKVTELSGLQPPPRHLEVRMDDVPVGTLAETANLWRFTYAPEWLGNPHRFPLAPGLPLQDQAIAD
jgi:serine/threonine-protein kinase HipA